MIIDIMDAVVQFVRNALCCMKDLQFFHSTGIHKSAQLSLPGPMEKTTQLEVLIGITQFYAFVSVSRSGIKLILDSGLRQRRTMQNLLKKLQGRPPDAANNLLIQRLEKEKASAQRNLFVGVNVFCIGVAFFWLFANSFHVTETTWIGGLPALIHALTLMEIALVPLLYYMISDTITLIGKAAVMAYLANILRKCTDKVPNAILTEETLSFLDDGWIPFWAGKSVLSDDEEEKGISQELKNLASGLELWIADNDDKRTKALIKATAARLESDSVSTRYEAYREFLYFILNFVAFYGYMLGILVYYAEAEDDQSVYVRALKFGMTNNAADWTGNFAGDLMWTIGEKCHISRSTPLVTVANRLFLRRLQNRSSSLEALRL